MGVCPYAGLVMILRVTGRRTLSKMNAFDFVVTVALGSTLTSAMLSSDVSVLGKRDQGRQRRALR